MTSVGDLSHPFLDHLVSVLSVLEQGNIPTPIPRYDGPSTAQTQSILKSIESLGRRAIAGENTAVTSTVSMDAAPPAVPESGSEELQSLKNQMSAVTEVCNSVFEGDFSRKITISNQTSPMVELSNAVNNMVDRLATIAQEVTRVGAAVEKGELGGQALEISFGGTWTELANVVNSISSQLTDNVRAVSQVVMAVTEGDFSFSMDIEVHGEMRDLKYRLNNMVNRIHTVTSELVRVSTEVGVRGRLGHQAKVPEAEGAWRELVGNINRTCATLTELGRSVAFVCSCIARQDYTQMLTPNLQGELLSVQEAVNGVVEHLGNTHQPNGIA